MQNPGVAFFGRMPDGTPVERVTLTGGGLTAHLLTYGATLQDLRLDGHPCSLVLGFSRLEDYLVTSGHFGALAGRCANRIRNATFVLDGRRIHLERNEHGCHHLHGGTLGTGRRVWRLEDARADHASLSVRLPDGEMGYPGAIDIRFDVTLLPDGVLDLHVRAAADQPTLCNLAHHSYFNLDGSATVLDHLLTVHADDYLPVDASLIPMDDPHPVEGTRFDLRRGRGLSADCPLAHNYCVAERRRPLTEVARLVAPGSGVGLSVSTTEPGLQVYDGERISANLTAADGRTFGPFGGVALEPQVWPDAINHAAWFSPVLRPGDDYRQRTRYRFTRYRMPESAGS